MPDIGYASMPVIPTFKGLQNDLERGSSKALTAAGTSGGTKFGDSASKSARRKFSASAKSIVAPLVGAFAAIRVGDFLKDAVTGASDLAESTNKVQQVFGKGSGAVFKFSEGASKAIGQTNQQARDAAATFGVFGKAAKFSDKQNAKFAVRMTGLASDLASFSNTSPDQAIEALGAALRGEAEPIRAYGVLLDDATLKAEAMRIGILKPTKDKNKILASQARVTAAQSKYNEELKKHGKDSIEAVKAQASLGTAQSALQKATAGTIAPLTQQQKVIAAQSSVLRQTKLQQGDFARTSGGLANQQRILSARWTDAKTALGEALLPAVNKAVLFLNQKGIPAFEKFADMFQNKGVPAIKKFADNAKPFIKDVLGEMRDVLKDIAPFAQNVVDTFNRLPDGVKKGLLAGAGLVALKKVVGGGAGGAKAGVVRGVASATKGALVTKTGEFLADKLLAKFAKPLPVFVTNPSFGGGGGKGGTLGKVGKAAGVAGIGAGGLAIGTVAALTVGAIAAAKFGASVEKGHPGLPKFGSADNPMDPQALTPNFGKGDVDKKAESLKRAAFYAENVNRVVDKLPGKIERGFNPAENLKRGISRVKRESELATGQTKALGDMLFQVSRNWDKATAAKKRYNELQTLNAQGVTPARQSKVDRQLGSGGMYVANMNVHGTSLPEVRRDAQHQQRARAMGSESFR